MKTLQLFRIAILLATSPVLYSSTQAFAQTAKAADGTSAQPPAAESTETTKIRLTRKSAAYWEVTFNNPPLNIVGPVEVRDLVKILDQIEADPKVKVVVFDSAVPDYFMAHYDLLKPLKDSTSMEPGPTGMHPVPDLMVRLSRLKAVTIVSIRGRASGIGSELALASWPQTLRLLSSAHESGRVPPGEASHLFFQILDLAGRMLSRAEELSREAHRESL